MVNSNKTGAAQKKAASVNVNSTGWTFVKPTPSISSKPAVVATPKPFSVPTTPVAEPKKEQ